MSERTKNLHATQEAADLSSLRASAPESARSNGSPDLASASIQSIPVARVSARQEKRPLSKLIPSPTISSLREQASKDLPRKRGSATKPHGIFKNPYFKYEGGPIGRIVAFLANLLKALETALLQRLKPTPQAAPKVAPPAIQPNELTTRTKKKATPAEGHKVVRDSR